MTFIFLLCRSCSVYLQQSLFLYVNVLIFVDSIIATEANLVAANGNRISMEDQLLSLFEFPF